MIVLTNAKIERGVQKIVFFFDQFCTQRRRMLWVWSGGHTEYRFRVGSWKYALMLPASQKMDTFRVPPSSPPTDIETNPITDNPLLRYTPPPETWSWSLFILKTTHVCGNSIDILHFCLIFFHSWVFHRNLT